MRYLLILVFLVGCKCNHKADQYFASDFIGGDVRLVANGDEILVAIKGDGEIYVRGKKATNDEVVAALKTWAERNMNLGN